MVPTDSKSHAHEALIKAAERLFTDKGYEAVSTRELADAAGVNLAAIQYHFGSKAKLFVETVHHLMRECACDQPHLKIEGEIAGPEDAATKLVQFIGFFLDRMLHPTGPQPCRMMFREIFTKTSEDREMFEALISSVVQDYMTPTDQFVLQVLQVLAPRLSAEEIEYHVQSIIGQCTFYVTHEPFLTRLRSRNFSDRPHFDHTVTHIAKFSLRALGCSAELIERALAHAGERGGH